MTELVLETAIVVLPLLKVLRVITPRPIKHRADKWKCSVPWIYREYAKKYC